MKTRAQCSWCVSAGGKFHRIIFGSSKDSRVTSVSFQRESLRRNDRSHTRVFGRTKNDSVRFFSCRNAPRASHPGFLLAHFFKLGITWPFFIVNLRIRKLKKSKSYFVTSLLRFFSTSIIYIRFNDLLGFKVIVTY